MTTRHQPPLIPTTTVTVVGLPTTSNQSLFSWSTANSNISSRVVLTVVATVVSFYITYTLHHGTSSLLLLDSSSSSALRLDRRIMLAQLEELDPFIHPTMIGGGGGVSTTSSKDTAIDPSTGEAGDYDGSTNTEREGNFKDDNNQAEEEENVAATRRTTRMMEDTQATNIVKRKKEKEKRKRKNNAKSKAMLEVKVKREESRRKPETVSQGSKLHDQKELAKEDSEKENSATPSTASSIQEMLKSIESCSDRTKDSLLQLNFTLQHDIDYSIVPRCGNRKCFFQSLRQPQIGYLIADSGFHRILRNSWGNSCGLSAKNHQHIYTRIPPTLVDLSQDQREQFLKAIMTQGGLDDDIQLIANKIYGRSTQLVVLQVKNMKPRSSWAEVNLKRQPRYIEDLYNVLIQANNNRNHQNTPIQNYLNEVQRVVKLVYEIPRLAHDFQMMVLDDGSIVHYDLDRIGEARKSVPDNEVRSCVCEIQKDAWLIKHHRKLNLAKQFQATNGDNSYLELYRRNMPLFAQEIEECQLTDRVVTSQRRKPPQGQPIPPPPPPRSSASAAAMQK